MKHEKTIEQQYQVLSELEHIRKRTGMWAGSPVLETKEEFVFDSASGRMVRRSVSSIPALIKIISEVIDNVVDEHKRRPTVLDQLKVDIGSSEDPDEIVIYDNGGIPVKMHAELGKYVPEIIFGQLRSGSNYDDSTDQAVIGTNGLGAKLTNILSEYFIIETADGENSFKQEYTDGMNRRSEPKIKSSTKHFTKITFKPDYKFFGINGLDTDLRDKIIKRLYDVAGCNPDLKVFINGERVQIKSFKDYIALYADEYVYEEYPNWLIGVAPSDGFQQTSFVNAVETYMGGTHVDYVTNQIVNELREFFKKKHKVDVKPGDIRAHMHVFISCNINRPRYSSQTKENMISAVSDFGSSVSISDKFIKRIIGSSVIQSVLDWVMAKQKAAELAELRKKNKDTDKINRKSIKKFHDATTQDRSQAILFLAEGDSAMGSILDGRAPEFHACFPLRGRPINVSAQPMSKIKENAEFENIRALVGLKYGETADIESLNFGKIAIASDADSFGASIAGLIVNMFYRLWPELVEAGMIYRLCTPMIIAKTSNGKVYEFFDEEEFLAWKETSTEKYQYEYLKGLGSSEPEDFRRYMSNLDKYLVQFEMDEEARANLDLCFSKEEGSSDRRKEWLALE